MKKSISETPDVTEIKGIPSNFYEKLRDQAKLIIIEKNLIPDYYEVTSREKNRWKPFWIRSFIQSEVIVLV